MSEIRVGSLEGLTVADAVLVDDAAFVDNDARRQGDRTLAEWSEE